MLFGALFGSGAEAARASSGEAFTVPSIDLLATPDCRPAVRAWKLANRATYAVYIGWDSAGEALYVGYSYNVHDRLERHQRYNVTWWPACVRVDWFATEGEQNDALNVEATLIRYLRPRFNGTRPERTISLLRT